MLSPMVLLLLLASIAVVAGSRPAAHVVRHPRSPPSARRWPPAMAATAWGGELAGEAAAAVDAVQRAMRLCNALACEMAMVESKASGKEMEECDVQLGMSTIKPGDSTPVTAADFAIQGLISSAMRDRFPSDRFLGEEDAADLRADGDLRSLARKLCGDFGCDVEESDFLDAVDRGLEEPRGEGERIWVLDPIDGTKGFMTGQGYVIGLALLDANGEALIGVMGVPSEESAPPIMAAVRGHGLRWWGAQGSEQVAYEVPRPKWADEPLAGGAPPWLISPQKAAAEVTPFGAAAPPDVVCCGAMIKYHAVAAGRAAGFIQYEETLKTWDHACALICVSESGGTATDANSQPVTFPGRSFSVSGGVVCASKFASAEVREALLQAATRADALAV